VMVKTPDFQDSEIGKKSLSQQQRHYLSIHGPPPAYVLQLPAVAHNVSLQFATTDTGQLGIDILC